MVEFVSAVSEVGEKVRKRRAEMGISQTELAYMIARTQGTVSNVESGRTEPQRLTKAALEVVLSIPLGTPPNLRESTAAALAMAHRLTPPPKLRRQPAKRRPRVHRVTEDERTAKRLVAKMRAEERKREQVLAEAMQDTWRRVCLDAMTPTAAVMARDPDEIVSARMDQEFVRMRMREVLTYRERRVLEMLYGFDDTEPQTLDVIGRTFNVSRERIRQIHNQALKKLQRPLLCCSRYDAR